MNMKNLSVRRLVRCAVIAAVYVVVCLVLAPFSYGAVQVRVAEALCLLPVFGAEYIVGVTLGCFLANLLGSTVVDVVFGTLATLLACLVTYKLRDIRVKGLAIPASLPPVVFNMIIVGAFEITFFFSDGAPTAMLAVFNAVTVGIGELISCTILGVALVKLIESNAGLNMLSKKREILQKNKATPHNSKCPSIFAKSAGNTLCITEHFCDAGDVPQPPERCLSPWGGNCAVLP